MAFIGEFGGKLPNGYFRRNQFHECGQKFDSAFEKFRKENLNKDIYICAYKYEPDESGVADIKTAPLMGDIYFDFDIDKITPDSYSKLKASVLALTGYFYKTMEISNSDIRIYFSGSKGFHVIIPAEIFSIKPDINLNKQIEKFVKFCASKSGAECIDFGIYDRRRLFRVPGSINSKSGLYKVPVTAEQLALFSCDDLLEWAKKDHPVPDTWKTPEKNSKAVSEWEKIQAYEEPKKEHKAKHSDRSFPLLPCAQAILNSGVSSGQRNIAGVALASSLLQSNNVKKEEILDLMDEWNERINPPIDISEVRAIYLSALKMNDAGMFYGCSSFKRLGFCVETCKFNV